MQISLQSSLFNKSFTRLSPSGPVRLKMSTNDDSPRLVAMSCSTLTKTKCSSRSSVIEQRTALFTRATLLWVRSHSLEVIGTNGGAYFHNLEETWIKVMKVVVKHVLQEVFQTVTVWPTLVSRKWLELSNGCVRHLISRMSENCIGWKSHKAFHWK